MRAGKKNAKIHRQTDEHDRQTDKLRTEEEEEEEKKKGG